MDTFIIVTSIGLATRFKQINQRLEEIKNEVKSIGICEDTFCNKNFQFQPMDESLWADIRHHYVQLCELVEVVDKNLAVIILLCCSNNLYFICFQLLNIFKWVHFSWYHKRWWIYKPPSLCTSLKIVFLNLHAFFCSKMPHMINFLYFWYSLLYLLGRTIAVFLAASMINDSAKYPVKYVRQRQTCEWCSEVNYFRNCSLGASLFSFITFCYTDNSWNGLVIKFQRK